MHLAQGLGSNFVGILGQLWRIQNPFELSLHQRLPVLVEVPPPADRAQQPCSNLRIQGINLENSIAKISVPLTAGVMKSDLIAVAEGPDDGTDLVWILQIKSGMILQVFNLLQSTRKPGRRLNGKPLVENQRI